MFIVAVNLQGAAEFPALLPDLKKSVHIQGRNTLLYTQGREAGAEVLIPSRDKGIRIFGDSSPEFSKRLEVLDSIAPGQTQASKLRLIQTSLPDPHLTFLEIHGQHPGGAFLAEGKPVWSYLVFSAATVFYSFGSYDFGSALRTYDPSVWLFRLPTVNKGCMFWSTEALCSKWWRWAKTFDKDRLKCSNALELHLYGRRMVV